MKKLFLIFSLLLFPLVGRAWEGRDPTIYWALDGDASVDDTPNMLFSFIELNYPQEELGVRISAYDTNGNFLRYLNPAWPEYGIDWEYNDSVIGVIESKEDLWYVSAQQAYYGEPMLEKLFQMEVGHYDEDYNFIPFLYSNAENVDGHWYDWGTLLPPDTDWVPHSFYTINPVIPAIPEPNSLLLTLLGLAALGLRRRRR